MPLQFSWPISPDDLRSALGYEPGDGDESTLEMYAHAACEEIDRHTGRTEGEPHRHERADGSLPVAFLMAARETAKVWVQADTNGPKGQPDQAGPPGGELPLTVVGRLKGYPKAAGIA